MKGRTLMRLVSGMMLVGAVLAFLWPLHALASRVHPLVLGIPFSITWIFSWQVAVFLGLLLLYRSEDGDSEQ